MNEQLVRTILDTFSYFRVRIDPRMPINHKSDIIAAQLTKIYFDQNNPQQLSPNDLKREELKQLRVYLEDLVKKYGDKNGKYSK